MINQLVRVVPETIDGGNAETWYHIMIEDKRVDVLQGSGACGNVLGNQERASKGKARHQQLRLLL
jgi:hypothetical protein